MKQKGILFKRQEIVLIYFPAPSVYCTHVSEVVCHIGLKKKALSQEVGFTYHGKKILFLFLTVTDSKGWFTHLFFSIQTSLKNLAAVDMNTCGVIVQNCPE